MNYGDFKRKMRDMNSNEAVVASLLRICCEEENPKAIQMAFERILGKPEHVIIIKRTLVRTLYPDAKTKALEPVVNTRVMDETQEVAQVEEQIVISEADAPGILLKKELEAIGDMPRAYAYDVIDDKDNYTVAEVMVASLYSMAMAGENLKAIDLVFNYLDGAVADVIRLEGEDTILLESWADVAPYEAILGDDGIYYLETESVK